MWIERLISARLLRQVESRPVLLLTGARQTGKSSLLQKLFPQETYITFDHLRLAEEARENPETFLRNFSGRTILDEIQYVPELFRELKIIVDQERRCYGRWLLTGSQNFALMEEVGDSLAGRLGILNLETLAAAELRAAGFTGSSLEKHLYLGGYPELWSNPRLTADDFFEDYIRSYVERDLRQLIEVKNLNDFRRFFRSLASRIGQLLNYRSLAQDIGVSDSTCKRWLHALEMSGLILLLPPFFTNLGKRLVKAPKLYFADHGLAAHLLGIGDDSSLRRHPGRGPLWENFVLTEIIKTRNLRPGREIFFYRDQNGVEIDFVIEQGRELSLVEAKAGERLDRRKLNFNKVAPLLKDKYEVSCLAAHPLPQSRPALYREFQAWNPLLCDFQEAVIKPEGDTYADGKT